MKPESNIHKIPAGVAAVPRAQEHWCELCPDAIVGLDEEWRITCLNRAARQLLPGGDTLKPGQQPWECAALLAMLQELHLDRFAAGEHPRSGPVRRVETGDALYEISVAVAGDIGTRIFTLAIRDASRQKPDQQILAQSQKGRLIGAIAGGVAHDFNNILTAVICQLDLVLLHKDLPPATRESLARALKSARRGAELNARLLEFSRQSEAQPAAVNVPRLVDETLFLLRLVLDHRIQVRVQSADAGLWPARVDPRQLTQVLMHLGLNARDAMPSGGELFFGIANRQFAAADARPPRHPGEFVEVTVGDTGHGMTQDVLARLFEPYFTTKDPRKGAGLGLSIANHVVVEHGGWMEVESAPSAGSRFHLFLPRASGPAAAADFSAETAPRTEIVLDGHETVLLVDDEEPVRAVIQAMLTLRGYKIIEARDGQEAIERFRADRESIDAVLLDIRMPRMNGWDALEKIHELNPRVPVLLLSGGVSDTPRDGGSGRAAGVLRKPFASVELLRNIRTAIDASQPKG